jgi:ubiquinone/menaquinone biosynthesis C-methylase UbiE
MRKKNVNTITFENCSSVEYKEQTKVHWAEAPCGTNYTQEKILSRNYFEEIETHRYHTHPWIKEAIDRFNIKGKDVLEIGFGVGTDHLNLARRGGKMHGIDLTPKHHEITRERLFLYGFESNLIIEDAEKLPYENESFDFVYSFGVVHHTPDTKKAIAEIYRVLKPGGRCWLSVYNKNSIFFWWSIFLVEYLLKMGRRKRSLKQQLSLIEYPNINENMVIKLYKRREFEKMFHYFSNVKTHIRHLLPVDIAYVSAFYSNPYNPNPLLNKIGKKLGWYIVLDALK